LQKKHLSHTSVQQKAKIIDIFTNKTARWRYLMNSIGVYIVACLNPVTSSTTGLMTNSK
jgi:hypothetical protein